MVKKGTINGNASPILKTCVAFNLECLVKDTVVLAFEHRLSAADCDKIAFEYGQFVAASALSLPQGKFVLHSDFYESAIDTGIVIEGADSYEIYESVGAYAESIDVDTEDVINARHYLDLASKFLSEVFAEAGFKDMPSEAELQQMCVSGENYAEMQKKLHDIFGSAQEQGQFNKLMYQAMAGFHQAYMEEFCEGYDFGESGELVDYHIYQSMPFGVVPEVTVAKVYTNFLPILLASGVRLDQASLFAYRLDCGRKMLRQFAGSDMENDPIEALDEALSEKIEKLVPYIPAFAIRNVKESGACRRMAEAFVRDIWFSVPVEVVESDEIEEFLSALCMALGGMEDDFDD